MGYVGMLQTDKESRPLFLHATNKNRKPWKAKNLKRCDFKSAGAAVGVTRIEFPPPTVMRFVLQLYQLDCMVTYGPVEEIEADPACTPGSRNKL